MTNIRYDGVKKPPKFRYCHSHCTYYSVFCMQYSSWSSGCSSGHTHSPQASGLWSLSHPSQSQFVFYPVAAYIHTFLFIFTFISYPASIFLSHQTKVNLSFILYLPSIDLSIRVSYLYPATRIVLYHKKNVKTLSRKGIFLQRLKALALPI